MNCTHWMIGASIGSLLLASCAGPPSSGGRPYIRPDQFALVQYRRRDTEYRSLILNLDDGVVRVASGPTNCDLKSSTVALDEAELQAGRTLFAPDRVRVYEGVVEFKEPTPRDVNGGSAEIDVSEDEGLSEAPTAGPCFVGSSLGVQVSVALPPGNTNSIDMAFPTSDSTHPETQRMLEYLNALAEK